MVLCLFAQFFSWPFKNLGAIPASINAVKNFRLSVAPMEGFENFQVKWVLKNINMKKNNPPVQARPLTLDLLLKIKDVLALDCLKDTIFLIVLLTGFFSLARSNV